MGCPKGPGERPQRTEAGNRGRGGCKHLSHSPSRHWLPFLPCLQEFSCASAEFLSHLLGDRAHLEGHKITAWGTNQPLPNCLEQGSHLSTRAHTHRHTPPA